MFDVECASSYGFREIKRLEDFRIASQCEFEGKLRSSVKISFAEKPGYASTAELAFLKLSTSNNVFATYARSDYFGCLMHEVLTKTFALMRQYSSCAEYVSPDPDDLRSNELSVTEFSYQPADKMVTKHYGRFAQKFEDDTGAKPFPLREKEGNDFSWLDGSARLPAFYVQAKESYAAIR